MFIFWSSKHIHLLAASGAIVTVYDTSHNQLKEDEKFAKENNLMISTIEGDMTNLEIFKDNFFDMIFVLYLMHTFLIYFPFLKMS